MSALDRFAAQRGAEELERVATWLDRIGEHDHADSLKATILNRHREGAPPQTGGGDDPRAEENERRESAEASRLLLEAADFFAATLATADPRAWTTLMIYAPKETSGGDAGERARHILNLIAAQPGCRIDPHARDYAARLIADPYREGAEIAEEIEAIPIPGKTK